MNATNRSTLELWGGAECTINRVGDRFFSQLARSGHRARLDDLDRFAELGIRALRFPILWEELAPESPEAIDWTPVDAQLQRLRSLGVRPIAGLLHHGSGPRYTSLLDPQFPQKLADFARRVAERYPWIDTFTPVNEPLTTARFSGLYGHWFPHGRDSFTFARIFLNQCRGVVLAMRAIRGVNPAATLLQTEDLGKTYSSEKLRYQADFENERRWLTWDLLSGRVTREHPMWSYFEWTGIADEEVQFFAEDPLPPSVIGVNHYVTSERYLDEDLRDHPVECAGGNGRDRYADVSAVRVRIEGVAGPESILREASLRYRLPVAVTEAHLGCTREEQLRWFTEVWSAAERLRCDGHDVRAVTAWSLLGAFDWNSLLTESAGYYEPGAFDIRANTPRPTAVAKMLGELGRGRTFRHPALDSPGWWRRSMRLIEPVRRRVAHESWRPNARHRPILLTGAGGRLAKAFAQGAEMRALACRLFNHAELDIADEGALANALQSSRPWAVINCAGFSNVDTAEKNENACRRANLLGAETLAHACARENIPLVTFSSDYVFNGLKPDPYDENDQPEALNVYGESKLAAEAKILATMPGALVLRLGKVFGSSSQPDFLRDALQTLANGNRIRAACDIRFSPVYLPDLVNATLDLLLDEERGLWHLANSGSATPAELIQAAADHAQLDIDLIEAVPFWSLHRPALRPRNRALRSTRGQLLPSWHDAVGRYWRESPPLQAPTDSAFAFR